jgi:hypothetical protein
MGLDLVEVLGTLSGHRPVFHSEADFQLSLGWEIQHRLAGARVRAEVRPFRGVRLDLMVVVQRERTAIELKYMPQRFLGSVNGEAYELPGGAPRDLQRYDILKDLARVERIVADGLADRGIVIALTSDPGYWRTASRADVIDAAFHLAEARVLPAELSWSDKAGVGTVRGREQPITLQGAYSCLWREYSRISDSSGAANQFRYLMLEASENVAREGRRVRIPDPGLAALAVAAGMPRQAARSGGGARQEILEAARALAARSFDGSFSVLEVVQEMARRGSRYQESTVRTHVTSVMCRDAPTHHLVTHDDLERVERGRYRLKALPPGPA